MAKTVDDKHLKYTFNSRSLFILWAIYIGCIAEYFLYTFVPLVYEGMYKTEQPWSWGTFLYRRVFLELLIDHYVLAHAIVVIFYHSQYKMTYTFWRRTLGTLIIIYSLVWQGLRLRAFLNPDKSILKSFEPLTWKPMSSWHKFGYIGILSYNAVINALFIAGMWLGATGSSLYTNFVAWHKRLSPMQSV